MNLKRNYPKPSMKRGITLESRVDRIERNLIKDMQAGLDFERKTNLRLSELDTRTTELIRYY